jgi:hypothetical protein
MALGKQKCGRAGTGTAAAVLLLKPPVERHSFVARIAAVIACGSEIPAPVGAAKTVAASVGQPGAWREARAGNAEAAGVASRAKKGQESMENELARTGG